MENIVAPLLVKRNGLTREPAYLPCEERTRKAFKDAASLESLQGSTPCGGTPTLHAYAGSELRNGVEYLYYACSVCGHKRIWGNQV